MSKQIHLKVHLDLDIQDLTVKVLFNHQGLREKIVEKNLQIQIIVKVELKSL